MVEYPVLTAMDRVLQRNGSSFNNELSDYSIWNYFTGARSDSINYYPEGSHYDTVSYELDQYFTSDIIIPRNSNRLAFSYYNFYDTEYNNNITLIPVNLNQDLDSGSQSDFTFKLSRQSGDNYNEIAYKFYVSFIRDNPSVWNLRAVITDAYGNIFIDSMAGEPVLGFGPNPFIVNKHTSFNVYYQLKCQSSVEIIIFSENGKKIKEFKIPHKTSGPHKFSWDQAESGAFPGGSGVYILFFKTDYSQDIFKFAVIR